MSTRFSFASGTNATYLESMYSSYQENPESVDESWQIFFAGYEFALSKEGQHGTSDSAHNHAKIEAFINTYRRLGHLNAHLNPLGKAPSIQQDMLPENHGLGKVAVHEKFLPANFGSRNMSFVEIWDNLKATYCGRIGADYREINNIEAVLWLQEKMESCQNKPNITSKQSLRILNKLAEAEGFEKFLQLRYLGQKRFSLEGLESLIPLLDTLIDESANEGLKEITLGMAHRGRLNVLTNIMGKAPELMLSEFEGSKSNPFDIDGDVKYHLGFAKTVETFSGKSINLYLSPNPSHLEAVNPVVEGFSRRRQEQLGENGREKIMPVLLHGDASFIGQGIISETLNLSKLPDYETGGTIHIITNNQIGFTTNPQDSRSCSYSSDISKVVRAPVFHVNADDPEAVVWIAKLAVMYRNKFKEDVVIDLVGYRRHGHNETDEPSFTQPLMYKIISKTKSSFSLYSSILENKGILTSSDTNSITADVKDKWQKAYEKIKIKDHKIENPIFPKTFEHIFQYKKINREEALAPVETKISQDILRDIGNKILTFPKGFTAHPKLARIYKNRKSMLDGEGQIDWGFAELLAFTSLSSEGHGIRLSGQDCKRGTFSSRHGVVFDSENGKEYAPLQKVAKAKLDIINSPLSEQGCLGFEFGYSVADPSSLVLWEAQFGDFANGAQIIIDQFLAASEAKWQQTSGLVLLLPHGHEGMGPEHSSARPERFLQASGNLNIQVCNVTSPAQLFHILRRQVKRSFRKPLVLMTPKSLLRHPKVKSSLKSFCEDRFHEVLDDTLVQSPEKAEKIICCTGKIYYELMETAAKFDLENTIPILRLEQLYPFPFEQLNFLIKEKYKNIKEVVWVQEEPQNMGAWHFVRARLKSVLKDEVQLKYVGRKHSGSTAEGSGKAHLVEQNRIIEEAFGLVCAWDPVHNVDERKKLVRL